jgi:hypothetical protein
MVGYTDDYVEELKSELEKANATIAELREFMAKQQAALVLSGDRTLAERARAEAAEADARAAIARGTEEET